MQISEPDTDFRRSFPEEPFENLMMKRISEVLLICNEYDAFMLEEDGRIEEKVFKEYSSLHLRFSPHFNRASSLKDALELMKKKNFDLIITLHNSGSLDAFGTNLKIKRAYPDKTTVVLTPFSRNIMTLKDIEKINPSSDYVFSWLGDTSILVAIIKLIEDKMNVDDDISSAGVQVILLIEDSIRYYSSYLPVLYQTIFDQTLHVMNENLNDHQKNLRMRGRPKILHVTNYEEAVRLYKKYRTNILGIISDVEFPKGKTINKHAGIDLCREIRKDNPYIPFLIQSSINDNQIKAERSGAAFINKQSENILNDISSFVSENFGFGEFSFKNTANGKIIKKASNLKELQKGIETVPLKSLLMHAERNDFSKWLRARTLFNLASVLKPKRINDFSEPAEVRNYMSGVIENYRRSSSIGTIVNFSGTGYDELSGFSRIGNGSIGGKARGLAFMNRVLKTKRKSYFYYNIVISIPQTVVLATDIFTEFMDSNGLYPVAFSDSENHILLDEFLKASLPEYVMEELKVFLTGNKKPLAVRSSSLLEDSYYQPFAGIYSTYMISNNSRDFDKRLSELVQAVKCVYASTYFKGSKKYLKATRNVIEEEKMAVVIQNISGSRHGHTWYPTFSGVARSVNNYPVGYEKHNISIANIAAGLGKTIVDGEVSLRFSPSFPNNIIQMTSADYALKYTQKHFYALSLKTSSFKAVENDSANLIKRDIHEGVKEGAFNAVVSTYDHQSGIIRDTDDFPGPKIVSFGNILKRETFPLSRILLDLLSNLEKSMNNPVEMEFAVNIDPEGLNHSFDLLQARPVSSNFESSNIDISELDNDQAIIKSFSSLGNGLINNIRDIVYIVPEKFDPAKTRDIASTIKTLNKKFMDKNRNYILIGPGRWGTSDPWLGIPVRWEDVSQASVIIEAGQKDFVVQQSQGSHFFHNITTFGVFYFSINPFLKDGFYDLDFLAQFKPVFEDDFIRHICFKKPLTVKTDGRFGHGIVLKP